MATKSSSQTPVLRVITELQQGLDVRPNPEDKDLARCGAMKILDNERANLPCEQRNSKAKVEKTTELLNMFRAEQEPPTDDVIFDKMEDFIRNTHCYHHVGEVIERFQIWKSRQRITTPKTITVPSSIEEIDSQTTLNQSSHGSQRDISSIIPHSASDQSQEEILKPEIDGNTLASSLSTLTIEHGAQTTMVSEHHGELVETAQIHIIGHGLATLKRQGSLRDNSPVFAELHKHISESKQAVGVVYVLQHSDDDLFKIGWTTHDGENRLRQSGNCYRVKTKIIYESESAFACAYKAERLAHVVLRHHNYIVQTCEQCQGGHREWFKVPKKKVLETLKTMEGFIRLPAYTMQKGDMKLSPEAYSMVQVMCNFNETWLQDLMKDKTQQTDSSDNTKSNTITEIQVSIEASEVNESLIQDEAETSQTSFVDVNQLGTKDAVKIAARAGKKAGKKAFKGWHQRVSDTGTAALRHIRERSVEAENIRNGDGIAPTPSAPCMPEDSFNIEYAVAGLFSSLLPEEIRTKSDQKQPSHDDRQNYLASMKIGVHHYFVDFKFRASKSSSPVVTT